VKQSQGLPHEDFHVATKPALNLDRKITGATIGYYVAAITTCNTICDYHEKKKIRIRVINNY